MKDRPRSSRLIASAEREIGERLTVKGELTIDVISAGEFSLNGEGVV